MKFTLVPFSDFPRYGYRFENMVTLPTGHPLRLYADITEAEVKSLWFAWSKEENRIYPLTTLEDAIGLSKTKDPAPAEGEARPGGQEKADRVSQHRGGAGEGTGDRPLPLRALRETFPPEHDVRRPQKGAEAQGKSVRSAEWLGKLPRVQPKRQHNKKTLCLCGRAWAGSKGRCPPCMNKIRYHLNHG